MLYFEVTGTHGEFHAGNQVGHACRRIPTWRSSLVIWMGDHSVTPVAGFCVSITIVVWSLEVIVVALRLRVEGIGGEIAAGKSAPPPVDVGSRWMNHAARIRRTQRRVRPTHPDRCIARGGRHLFRQQAHAPQSSLAHFSAFLVGYTRIITEIVD